MKINSELAQALQFFTREKEIMSGLLLVCEAGGRTEAALDGDVREDSVFDLASLTKLFTGMCALRLKEDGLLDTSRSVFFYEPRFTGLKDTTVEQLMTFTAELKTPGRVDGCASREEALKCLFGTVSTGEPKGRHYSDIPSMALKYVLEAAAGMPFMDLVRETVLDKAGMTETWAKVPEERIKDCLCYAPEYRIVNGERTVRTGLEPGVPHDPKAAVIQAGTDDLCGHAGLFSTAADMTRFCRAVLAEKIISGESLREMARNRTGHPKPDGTYTQYLGTQCYVKHPDQYFSEIPRYMGMRAFGNAGFTGNHLSVDPENGSFVLFLGNRVQGRLTMIIGGTPEEYGLAPDGSGTILWEDGKVIPSSVKYVHQKDEHLHSAIAKVLGLKEIAFNS